MEVHRDHPNWNIFVLKPMVSHVSAIRSLPGAAMANCCGLIACFCPMFWPAVLGFWVSWLSRIRLVKGHDCEMECCKIRTYFWFLPRYFIRPLPPHAYPWGWWISNISHSLFLDVAMLSGVVAEPRLSTWPALLSCLEYGAQFTGYTGAMGLPQSLGIDSQYLTFWSGGVHPKNVKNTLIQWIFKTNIIAV